MRICSLAAMATIASTMVFSSVVFAQTAGQCRNADSKIAKLNEQITTVETKNEAAITKMVDRGLARIVKMREKAAARQEALRAKIIFLQGCATPTPSPTPTPSATPAPTA